MTSFLWQLENAATHECAGFPHIPEQTLRRRYWQFIAFIQEHGLTIREIAPRLEAISPNTAIRNSDLTQKGYKFVQKYGDRWTGRMHKDKGASAEKGFLEKWYVAFTSREA